MTDESLPSKHRGDWSVFNSGGACIIENVSREVAADYMTADRFARGWTMVGVEVIKSMAALAAAPQQVAAWMPIQTAPKDGTAIYVVVANALKPEAGVAHWFSDTWRGGQGIDWQGTENPHEHFGVYLSPTHWQPLPAPPSQASATGGV